MRDLSLIASNFPASGRLKNSLKRQHIVAIAGIDIRRLTGWLRGKSTLHGCIIATDITDKTINMLLVIDYLMKRVKTEQLNVSAVSYITAL